jgi:hypothetical protein
MKGRAALETLSLSQRTLGAYLYQGVVDNPKGNMAMYAQYYNVARINFLQGTGPIPPPTIQGFIPVFESTWPLCKQWLPIP